MVAELVNDGFAATFWEIDFDAEAEALLGNKDSRIMFAFFKDTESAEITIGMRSLLLGEAGFV